MLKTITGMALIAIICSSCAQKIVPADSQSTTYSGSATQDNSQSSTGTTDAATVKSSVPQPTRGAMRKD